MYIVLFILVVILLFVFFGLFGWVLKGLGVIFDFLAEGCSTSFGCLFWVFIILLCLAALV